MPPTGHLAMSRDILGCHNSGGLDVSIGVPFSDARIAAKSPPMHRTVLTIKNYLAQLLSRVEVGNP